ncbi:Sporulation integral membrane protein YlbJ [Lentibacillus sp. JNUCC-1]|uniref:sporulation integral membrane protein YlbJ n=1 Tax=Lentibacillus sp. JNUCC-1 TaxID=2654513 RepID=UPI001324E03F|nr:sporulation integral membrane protein YlbJ [Lentibacillus sp. JNUCC-1]MUV36239.1 Sporulation integral membrane protein YlbJ [Lentibacillus sp. JNUCC-1]
MRQIMMTLLLASLAVGLALALITFPEQSLDASVRGLNMWWEVVFPSLLPFFIAAELLIGFGVVQFIGLLFEPVMRPLFNVPGAGSFAWFMGMASGYPSGAKISARLREENQLTKVEAERLVSFTNASSPLFVFGAVAVGFFHDARLGLLLALAHYAGNTLVGLSMRFYKRRNTHTKPTEQKAAVSIKKAFQSMHRTRLNDPRPLGEVIGDAVLNAIQTLVMVGGFIILFSVLTKLLHIIGISTAVGSLIQYFFLMIKLAPELSVPFISGLFEITLGAQLISQLSIDSLLQKMVIVSFILGFNGFSVQAQVASILAKTDISFKPYFFARILHGMLAALLTILLYKPVYLNRYPADEAVTTVGQDFNTSLSADILNVLSEYGPFLTIASLGIAVLILINKKNQ